MKTLIFVAVLLSASLVLSCSRPAEDKTPLAITTLWILDKESKKESPAPDIFDTYIKLSEQYTSECPESEIKTEALKSLASFKSARENWDAPERQQLFKIARSHFERADDLAKRTRR